MSQREFPLPPHLPQLAMSEGEQKTDTSCQNANYKESTHLLPPPPTTTMTTTTSNVSQSSSAGEAFVKHTIASTDVTSTEHLPTLISRRKVTSTTPEKNSVRGSNRMAERAMYGVDNMEKSETIRTGIVPADAYKESQFSVTFTTSTFSLYYKQLVVVVIMMLFAVVPVLPSTVIPVCALTSIVMYIAHALHYRRIVVLFLLIASVVNNILLIANYISANENTIHSLVQLLELTLINVVCTVIGLIHFHWVQISFPALVCIAERFVMGVTPVVALPPALTLIYTYSEARRASLWILFVMCAEVYFFSASLKSSFLYVSVDTNTLLHKLETIEKAYLQQGKMKSEEEEQQQEEQKFEEQSPTQNVQGLKRRNRSLQEIKQKEMQHENANSNNDDGNGSIMNATMPVQLNSLIEVFVFAGLTCLMPLIIYTVVINHWLDNPWANLFNSAGLLFIYVCYSSWQSQALLWAYYSLDKLSIWDNINSNRDNDEEEIVSVVVETLLRRWIYYDADKYVHHLQVFDAVLGEWLVIGVLLIMQPWIAYRVLHCHYAYLFDTVPFPWNFVLLLIVLYSIMFVGLLMYSEYRIRHPFNKLFYKQLNVTLNKALTSIVILPFIFGPLSLCILLNVEVFFFLVLIAMTVRLIPPDYMERNTLDPSVRYMFIFVLSIFVMMWMLYLSGKVEETLPWCFGVARMSSTALNRGVIISYILLLACMHFYWMAAYVWFKVTLIFQLLVFSILEHVLYSQHNATIYSATFVCISSVAGLALSYYLFGNAHISYYYIALITGMMIAKVYAYFAETYTERSKFTEVNNGVNGIIANNNNNLSTWNLRHANNNNNNNNNFFNSRNRYTVGDTTEYAQIQNDKRRKRFREMFEHTISFRTPTPANLTTTNDNSNNAHHQHLFHNMPSSDEQSVLQSNEAKLLQSLLTTYDAYDHIIHFIGGTIAVTYMVYVVVLFEMELYAKVKLCHMKRYVCYYLLCAVVLSICSLHNIERACYEFVTHHLLRSSSEMAHVIPGFLCITFAILTWPFVRRIGKRYVFARSNVSVLESIGVIGLLLLWVQPTIHDGNLHVGASYSGNVKDSCVAHVKNVVDVMMDMITREINNLYSNNNNSNNNNSQYLSSQRYELLTRLDKLSDQLIQHEEIILAIQLFAIILVIVFCMVPSCRVNRWCRWIFELLFALIGTILCTWYITSITSNVLFAVIIFGFVLSYIITFEITHYSVAYAKYAVASWLTSVSCMMVCCLVLPNVINTSFFPDKVQHTHNMPDGINQINQHVFKQGKTNSGNSNFQLIKFHELPLHSLLQEHTRVKYLSMMASFYLFQAIVLRWRVSPSLSSSLLPGSTELHAQHKLSIAIVANASVMTFMCLVCINNFNKENSHGRANSHSCILYILIAPLLLLLVNDHVLFKQLHLSNFRYLPSVLLTLSLLWLCTLMELWRDLKMEKNVYWPNKHANMNKSSLLTYTMKTLFIFTLEALLLLPSQWSLLSFLWNTDVLTHGQRSNKNKTSAGKPNNKKDTSSTSTEMPSPLQWVVSNVFLVILFFLPSSNTSYLVIIKWAACVTLLCQLVRLFSSELRRVKVCVEQNDDESVVESQEQITS